MDEGRLPESCRRNSQKEKALAVGRPTQAFFRDDPVGSRQNLRFLGHIQRSFGAEHHVVRDLSMIPCREVRSSLRFSAGRKA